MSIRWFEPIPVNQSSQASELFHALFRNTAGRNKNINVNMLHSKIAALLTWCCGSRVVSRTDSAWIRWFDCSVYAFAPRLQQWHYLFNYWSLIFRTDWRGRVFRVIFSCPCLNPTGCQTYCLLITYPAWIERALHGRLFHQLRPLLMPWCQQRNVLVHLEMHACLSISSYVIPVFTSVTVPCWRSLWAMCSYHLIVFSS